MPYQALYRKYRPQRFSELVDQEHVVGALRSAVRDGRVGHAYLLSGPRGTGKTTTARILAKALNCTQRGDDGEPCGECANCVAISSGTFLDLFELDAASNRGIENIRDVIDSASLGLGPSGLKKVYVLDEVHMLTDAASNALLKTLEEAPGHVVFVLATTNPEKVLPTIRSRTQHLEFTLISTDDLIGRLGDLCEREGVPADREALEVIATAAAGSARDAESLLDQALAHGSERLDAVAVAELFGGTAFDARVRMLEAIAAEDATGALVGLAELLESGHEPRRVAEDLLAAARDAFLLTAARGRVAVAVPADAQARLEEVGDALGNAALVRVIETLGQAIADMRGVEAADPRLVLEVALVRLSRREAGPPIQTVIERIERLERAQAGRAPASVADAPAAGPSPAAGTRRSRPTLGALRRESGPSPLAADAPTATATADAVTAAHQGSTGTPVAASPALAPAAEEAAAPTGNAAAPTDTAAAADDRAAPDLDDVILAWGEIVPALPPATRGAVQNAQPVRFDGNVLVFGVAPELLAAARERFKREADSVRDALAAKLGRRFKFSLVAAPELSLGAGVPSAGERAPSADAPRPVASDAIGEPPAPTEPPFPTEPRAGDDHTAARAPMPEYDDPEYHDEVDFDAPGIPPPSEPASLSRLRDELGATVVEELPREG